MNTTEFKAAIRPQLKDQIHTWLWEELDSPTMRKVAVGFRDHVRLVAYRDQPSFDMQFAVEFLPLSFNTGNTRYVTEISEQLVDVFLVDVDRYEHIDRSCKTCLRIKAYEYRLKNFLAEVAKQAHIAFDASSVKFVSSRGRKSVKPTFLPGAVGGITGNLKGLRFM